MIQTGIPTLQAASAATEWRDRTGRVLGQGSQLVYTAERVVMETLTAQVGESQSQVSFTVSTPDAQIQPHVKVLGDELAETVLALFPGLKQLESSLTLQLEAQAVAEAGFCPVFEPLPHFDSGARFFCWADWAGIGMGRV
ncbi:MAG: hypothetical protein SNJ68_09845 [Cyanobacteriota bacterium]